jgi:uncharacterized protein (TIGR02646 family)
MDGDFEHYRDSFDYLLARIGIGVFDGLTLAQYCSYCERVIPTNLAVEHIEPKQGEHGKPDLKNRWSNFLLSCVNCNSKKGTKKIDFDLLYFPDRDNTFHAFDYTMQGTVVPSSCLTEADAQIAVRTINLFGLNDTIDSDVDGVAKDRRTQRLNAYGLAMSALEDYRGDPDNLVVERMVIKGMVTSGYFSIWMKVFKDYPRLKQRFVDAIRGTWESGCFDVNCNVISPHPNADGLELGGKI